MILIEFSFNFFLSYNNIKSDTINHQCNQLIPDLTFYKQNVFLLRQKIIGTKFSEN